ncbi:MAG TPA: hypothetical protein VF618_09675 [Thermoanaerobaculia bacterium]
MKRLLIALWTVALLSACEVKKTGEDTYKVETPEVNTKEAEADARDAAQATKTAAQELGKDAKEAGRDAAQATGTALEKAGKKMQEHSKPGDQK